MAIYVPGPMFTNRKAISFLPFVIVFVIVFMSNLLRCSGGALVNVYDSYQLFPALGHARSWHFVD